MKPSALDLDCAGIPASVEFDHTSTNDEHCDWCYASLEDVRANMQSTGCPERRMRLVTGNRRIFREIRDADTPDLRGLYRTDRSQALMSVCERVRMGSDISCPCSLSRRSGAYSCLRTY